MTLMHHADVDFEVCLTRDKLIVVRVRCGDEFLIAQLDAEDARTFADALHKCADLSERTS